MKKIIIALLISLAGGVGAYAQTNQTNVNVNKPVIVLPDSARYQIIKLDYIFDTIIKLDRYNGKTYVYDTGKRRWHPLEVRGGLPAGAGNSPKYQIYNEGEYSTFLLNNESGQSWVLYVRTWEPVID